MNSGGNETSLKSLVALDGRLTPPFSSNIRSYEGSLSDETPWFSARIVLLDKDQVVNVRHGMVYGMVWHE
jgi:hypothetical protein